MKFDITYCSNVHPVTKSRDIIDYLNNHTSKVAKEFCPDSIMSTGLWIPAKALEEYSDPEAIQSLKTCLSKNNLEVKTFNAFPMNIFHGQKVKEKVYLPDWSSKERLEYTKSIASLAQKLDLKKISISTLGGGFKALDSDEKINTYIKQWIEWAQWAEGFYLETQTLAQLALEPEPFTTLESTADVLKIYEKLLAEAQKQNVATETIKQHIGICLDLCHFAVVYSPAAAAYKLFKEKDIPVYKIQVSLAPRVLKSMPKEAINQFFNLDEPVYLHQSFAFSDSKNIFRFVDLNEAHQFHKETDEDIIEWRTHFHIPIHLSQNENTTGNDLIEFIQEIKHCPSPPILEIETYSFEGFKEKHLEYDEDLNQSLLNELNWLRTQLQEEK